MPSQSGEQQNNVLRRSQSIARLSQALRNRSGLEICLRAKDRKVQGYERVLLCDWQFVRPPRKHPQRHGKDAWFSIRVALDDDGVFFP